MENNLFWFIKFLCLGSAKLNFYHIHFLKKLFLYSTGTNAIISHNKWILFKKIISKFSIEKCLLVFIIIKVIHAHLKKKKILIQEWTK